MLLPEYFLIATPGYSSIKINWIVITQSLYSNHIQWMGVFMCMCISVCLCACACPHHGLYHISLVIPQGFYSVENINNILLLNHFIDAANGTECSWTSSTSTVQEKDKEGEEGRTVQYFQYRNHRNMFLLCASGV